MHTSIAELAQGIEVLTSPYQGQLQIAYLHKPPTPDVYLRCELMDLAEEISANSY